MSTPAYQKTINVKATSSTAYTAFPGTNATLNLAGDVLDDTDFTSTGYRSRVVGLRDWSIDVTSNYQTTNSAFSTVRDAWLNRSRVDVQYLPDGSNGYSGTAYVESFSHSGDVGGLETVDITMVTASALSTV